jgi:hypothetical protein
MAASSKFPVLDRKVIFAGNGVFSPETRAKAFAEAAGLSIAEIDRDNDAALGRDVKYRTFVDGRETGNLFTAKETSVIAARWDISTGIISYIDQLLSHAGPHDTGAYQKTRAIYADDVEIDEPEKAAGAKVVIFTSLVPYARKIERGRKGYAPGHVYEAVAAMAKTRFSNSALVKFTYTIPEGSAPELRRWAMKKNSPLIQSKTRSGRQQALKNLRQPTIIVYL